MEYMIFTKVNYRKNCSINCKDRKKETKQNKKNNKMPLKKASFELTP